MIGAALGALLVWLVYKDHFNATDDPDAELGVFCTSPAIKDYPINFLGEMIGTFALMFVVFFITDGELTYESNSTLPIGLGSVGAIPVAFTVWVIGLSLGGTTGYAINPARDLAPRFIHFILPIKGKGSSHWEYAWVPVLGPIAGAAIAGMLYYVLNNLLYHPDHFRNRRFYLGCQIHSDLVDIEGGDDNEMGFREIVGQDHGVDHIF